MHGIPRYAGGADNRATVSSGWSSCCSLLHLFGLDLVEDAVDASKNVLAVDSNATLLILQHTLNGDVANTNALGENRIGSPNALLAFERALWCDLHFFVYWIVALHQP